VYVELLGKLDHRLFALDRGKRDFRLEGGAVVAAGSFRHHGSCSRHTAVFMSRKPLISTVQFSRATSSFFNLLKRERVRRRVYRSRDEGRQDVFDYIEMFYNPKRKHVRNGMLSPVEFEKQQKI
jgi:hypothetical protein